MSDWIEVETIEDIEIRGEEILIWDGCQHHIDYVDVSADTGNFFMANETEPTHWKPLDKPESAH